MVSIVPESQSDSVVFSSSLADDVWHRLTDPRSYELWYFDALSDDGSEAVTVTFLDNFVFSSWYNRPDTKRLNLVERATNRFPAVILTYSRDGATLFRSATEYAFSDFTSDPTQVGCKIGPSYFKHESAAYGSGFRVSVEGPLSGDKYLEAHFEWLSVESNLDPRTLEPDSYHHFCNIVAPRSDVTGRITVYEVDRTIGEVVHFRGTGYHHHRMDNRWMADTVADWYWGRAHFHDASVVFCRYREVGDERSTNRLLITQDGQLLDIEADYIESGHSRDKFGIRYPDELTFKSENGFALRIRPAKPVFSSFYLLRFVCQAELTLPDGSHRNNSGLVEFLVPGVLKNKWMNWLNES